MPLESYFLEYGKQDRQAGEFVESVFVPRPGVGDIVHISKLSRRFDSDISVVCGAFRLTVADGAITAARVAFGGMAATPCRAPRCEAVLTGAPFTAETIERAAEALRADYAPLSDVRGSAAYRLGTRRHRDCGPGAAAAIGAGDGLAAPTATRLTAEEHRVPGPDLDALIAALPKAELHLHIEGSLEPELMFALAKRNGVEIPFQSVEQVRAAYDFSNLQDFLDIYYAGATVLLVEDDFRDLAAAYFDRAAADNVRHAEIFFDPQTHTDRGVPMAAVIEGLLAGMAQAEARHGITSRLILCFLRHLDEEAAFATLAAAEPWLDRIAAVGLDSSEVGHPPSKFARVFARAGELGLKRVAHAGEEGPPEYVREALDLLHIDRLDHGNRSLEDPALVRRLADEGMTLTVCPLSNHKLCVVSDLARHPIARMLDLGLRATVNSDDPAYFGGYVGDNYRAIAGLVGREGLLTLARNSFSGAFIDEAARARHLAEIERVADQTQGA